jgi:hypothetical protein
MLPGFEPLEDNQQMCFGCDPARRILLMERKRSSDWVTAVEIIRVLRGLAPMLGTTTEDWGVLFDTRNAVGRNDPAFEVEAERLQDYLLEHFAQVAVLVRSAAGEMQVERMQEPRKRMAVFREIPLALRFASGVREAQALTAR